MSTPLLRVRNLSVHYKNGTDTLKAVDNVSFNIYPGETFGLVGESGCGKSTVAKSILRLIDITSGNISFEGEDITNLSNKKMKAYRKKMQIIFQDPFASLNPRMTAEELILEPMIVFKMHTSKERRDRVYNLLKLVGLSSHHGSYFPHELSGGQRQRVSIARALSLEPKFLVCDESISALDVSIQAQIINLFKRLQKELGLTYLFITHDLSVIKYLADRIGVMYMGRIIEQAPSESLYQHPYHPYTRSLLRSIPQISKKWQSTEPEKKLVQNKKGCLFSPRCKIDNTICEKCIPQYKELSTNHKVSCHHTSKLDN